MSKVDWNFLGSFLEKGQEYSTGVGRVWLTVLFLFRMLVLCTATELVWEDEQDQFICNTLQPGCNLVCYDKAFPISHMRFFILQIIFVCTPTIFYFGYVALYVSWEKKREQERQRREVGSADPGLGQKPEGEEKKKEAASGLDKAASDVPKLKGKLLRFYMLSIVLKVLAEVGFAVLLWYLYGFVVPAQYVCERWPCPHKVDCFISRPTEKTILVIYMYVMTVISVILNVVELLSLIWRKATHWLKKSYLHKPTDLAQVVSQPMDMSVSRGSAPAYSEKHFLHLPMGEGTIHPALYSRQDWGREPGPHFNPTATWHYAAQGAMAKPENRSGSIASSHSSSRTKKKHSIRDEAPRRHNILNHDRDRAQKKQDSHQNHGLYSGKTQKGKQSRLSL